MTKCPEFGTKSEGGIYGELGKLDHLGRPQDVCIPGYNFKQSVPILFFNLVKFETYVMAYAPPVPNGEP